MLQGYRRDAPDNGLRDGDSVPAATSAAKDNVASKRSGFDKARNKVKSPSNGRGGGKAQASRGTKPPLDQMQPKGANDLGPSPSPQGKWSTDQG